MRARDLGLGRAPCLSARGGAGGRPRWRIGARVLLGAPGSRAGGRELRKMEGSNQKDHPVGGQRGKGQGSAAVSLGRKAGREGPHVTHPFSLLRVPHRIATGSPGPSRKGPGGRGSETLRAKGRSPEPQPTLARSRAGA